MVECVFLSWINKSSKEREGFPQLQKVNFIVRNDSIGRFSVDFSAKLLTSSLAGVSGSLAFFFPIFLAVARQSSKQVRSLLLWEKRTSKFYYKTPPFSTKLQTGVAIVIRHLRTHSPAQNHRKEARPKPFSFKIQTDSSSHEKGKWCTYLEVSEILRVENCPIMTCIATLCRFNPQVTC